jgi:hypothetical protein
MQGTEVATTTDRTLLWLMTLYCAASFLHFAHNAEYLADYPNLPAWLTRPQVYVAWLGVTAIGALGYLIRRTGHELAGLALVGTYAALGFDGLLHYGRAPVTAHTAAMSLTIWIEVATAALLLGAVLVLATKSARDGR